MYIHTIYMTKRNIYLTYDLQKGANLYFLISISKISHFPLSFYDKYNYLIKEIIIASIVLHIEELNMGNDPNQLVTIDQFWMNRKGYLFFGERDDGKKLTMEEHYFSCEG